MSSSVEDVSFQLIKSDMSDILYCTISVHFVLIWNVIITPSSDRSIISHDALEDLQQFRMAFDAVADARGRITSVRLTGMRISGVSLPDVVALVGRDPARFRVEAILGRDFLLHYSELRYYPDRNVVTLIDP